MCSFKVCYEVYKVEYMTLDGSWRLVCPVPFRADSVKQALEFSISYMRMSGISDDEIDSIVKFKVTCLSDVQKA